MGFWVIKPWGRPKLWEPGKFFVVAVANNLGGVVINRFDKSNTPAVPQQIL